MMKDNREFEYKGALVSGFLMLAIIVIVCFVAFYVGTLYVTDEALGVLAAVEVLLLSIMAKGFFVQQPNQSRVMIFFGVYKGTCKRTGFFWANPFLAKTKVSLRIRNLDAAPIKVNDRMGNPVMIGMVLVWKVDDTYRAVFDVDAGESTSTSQLGGVNRTAALNAFVAIQGDAALREVTGRFAYDSDESDSDALTLRQSSYEINEMLEKTLNERLAMAGVEVVEARINYLAYAPEIAAVMLRRQQAAAIISAREKIVEGAVTMVKMALDEIENRGVARLDEKQRAQMVGNLLLVLCSDEPAQPVIPSGS